MFIEILNIIIPVFLCALVGFVWAKKQFRFDSGFVTLLVTNIGFPCLIFNTLIEVELTGLALRDMGLASLVTLAAFFAIAWPVLRMGGLDTRAFLPAMAFANTGNIGLPLCLLAFGDEGLALGIAYFAVNAVFVFTLGPAIAAGESNLREILKVPLVWAVLAALAIMAIDITVPAWLLRSVGLLGDIAIPLMLITLGVSLAELKISGLTRGLLLSALRLGMGFAVGWVTAMAFGFEGVARGVLIIECAMPAAVFNYLYAARYDNRPTEVAGVVFISTLMSFITLPALLWFVL